jgi:hypothetical protein
MNGNATGSARLSLDAFDAVFGSGAAPRTKAAVRSACCATSIRGAWVRSALTMSTGNSERAPKHASARSRLSYGVRRCSQSGLEKGPVRSM